MKVLALLILILLIYIVKAIIVGVSEGGKVLIQGINEAEKHLLDRNRSQPHISQAPTDQSTSPLLFNDKAPNTECYLVTYDQLANKYLTPNAINNKTIKKMAIKNLNGGHTPEEALMHSYFIDCALTANEARNKPNIHEMTEIVTSIMPILAIFKGWKDVKLVNEVFWSKITTLIYQASIPSPEQDAAINCAIEDLRYYESDSKPLDKKNGSRKDHKNQYVELAYEIHKLLQIQFHKIREQGELSDKLEDDFALGYVLGFSDYYLQNWHKKMDLSSSSEISADEIAAVSIVFMTLFGQELGAELFGKVLRDLERKSNEFNNGILAGNRDFLSYSNRNTVPVGLREYIESMIQV